MLLNKNLYKLLKESQRFEVFKIQDMYLITAKPSLRAAWYIQTNTNNVFMTLKRLKISKPSALTNNQQEELQDEIVLNMKYANQGG